jgi:hypothetical protein
MIHDTHFSQKIPLSVITPTVGTWAMTVASNVWTLNKNAADDTSVLLIPIHLPQNSVALKGSKLASVDLWYSVGTAACDAVDAVLQKITLPANGGSAPSVSTVTTSYDTGHDTAAERYAVAVHKLTLTITTPPWMDDDEIYYVELTVNAAATSVVKLFAARANFTLRA